MATQKKGGGAGANNFLVAASKHGFADYEDCNVIRVRHVRASLGMPHASASLI